MNTSQKFQKKKTDKIEEVKDEDLLNLVDSKEEYSFHPNTYTYSEIIQMNQSNINKYKDSKARLAYSEEDLEILNKNLSTNFTESDPQEISYNDLLQVMNVKTQYKIEKFQPFIFKNYDKNNNLIFNSKFESGNLRMAIKLSENEYDLLIRPDSYTYKAFRWFFFSVQLNDNFIKNLNNKNGTVKFNIINIFNKNTLFNEMVRILAYYNGQWTRNTCNIFDYPNGISVQAENFHALSNNANNSSEPQSHNCNIFYSNSCISIHNKLNGDNKDNNEQGKNEDTFSFITLTFSFNFNLLKNAEGVIEPNNNIVYFSYCYPYTYNYLTSYLSGLVNKFSNGDILRFETVGSTINGKPIYMLVITNFRDSFETLAQKPCVFLTSRVHPGESNGSFVIQGVIDFLLTNDQMVVELRKKYIFKIIPMLNPDGVTIGNFRTNLAGRDLNRMWIEADINISPSIYHTKNSVEKTLNSRDIFLFCDFHGHSQKTNFFIYSCRTKNFLCNNMGSPRKKNVMNNKCDNNNLMLANNYFSTIQTSGKELVFPFIFSNQNPYFDKYSCINKISPAKIKTARAVLKNEFNIDYSYCLEASVTGIKTANGNYIPFTIDLYKKIGKDFCISLFKMSNTKIFFTILSTLKNEKKEKEINKKKGKDYSANMPVVRSTFSNNCSNSNNVCGVNSNEANNKEVLPMIRYSPNSPKLNTIITKRKNDNVLLKNSTRNNTFKGLNSVNNNNQNQNQVQNSHNNMKIGLNTNRVSNEIPK